MMRILALIIIFLTFISACGTDKKFTKNNSVAEVSKKNPDVDLEGGKEIVLSGFILDGKDNSVVLIRGGARIPEIKKLDLESALDKGEVSQNMCLQTGDVVFVPRTFIANVDRFFSHFEKIIRPILFMEQAIIVAPRVEDVFQGESAGATKSKVPIVISPP